MKYTGITERSDVRMALLVGVVVLFLASAAAAADLTPAWIIVDDGDPGFYASANWGYGSSPGAYGGDFRWRATAPVNDPAVWAYNVETAGSYIIYARWLAGSNRSDSAPYIVYHSGGSTVVRVNQQVNGSKWVSLGTFSLTTGANQVKLSCWTTSGYVVIADAIAAAKVSVD